MPPGRHRHVDLARGGSKLNTTMLQTDSITVQQQAAPSVEVVPAATATPVQPVPVRRQPTPYSRRMTHADSAFFNLTEFRRDLLVITPEHAAAELRPSALHAMPADTTYHTVLHTPQTVEEYRAQFHHTAHHEPIVTHEAGWICAIALFATLVVTLARTQSRLLFTTLMTFTLSDYQWKKVMPTLQYQDLWPGRLMYFNFFVVVPVLVFELVEAHGLTADSMLRGPLIYIILLPCTVLFFYLKRQFTRLIAYIFAWGEFEEHFRRSETFGMDIAGVYCLPMMLAFAVVPEAYYPVATALTLCIVAAAYVWRLLNTVKIISLDAGRIFYIILYICAVDLMPVLVAFKAIEKALN